MIWRAEMDAADKRLRERLASPAYGFVDVLALVGVAFVLLGAVRAAHGDIPTGVADVLAGLLFVLVAASPGDAS